MQVGDIFDGRYRIAGLLGQGGMSRVYLAQNIKLGTYWAIKAVEKDQGAKIDLLAEPNILKRLEHKALPRIYDILEDEECIYVIMDYIEGTALDKKLEGEGGLPETLVLDWAKQLCEALGYLHSFQPNPIIYRDMKPSNIILTPSGTLKLIDFGTAREYKAQSGSDTVFIGTRGYAAPEQYGSGQTNVVSDIYSLGVTLHQLLTGKNPNEAPFEMKPVRWYDSRSSAGIDKLVSRCTMQNPSERYQSVGEILEDIRKMEGHNRVNGTQDQGFTDNEGVNTSGGSCGRVIKKLIITIWDNAEFGCEFAYTAAKLSGLKVMLADLDLLAPKADLFLNLRKYPGRMLHDGLVGNSGLNMVLDAIEKNCTTPELLQEASIRRSELKNLFILTGNYKIDNYEYYHDESLIKLIERCYACFDITVLLVNRSIYDSFTVISLAKSDLNLVAVRADVDKLREFNNYIMFLKEKQQIPVEKTSFVAFDYDKRASLTMSEVREATGGNLAGKISGSRKRAAWRNLNSSYAARMEKEITGEYGTVLASVGILPSRALADRLSDLFNARHQIPHL